MPYLRPSATWSPRRHCSDRRDDPEPVTTTLFIHRPSRRRRSWNTDLQPRLVAGLRGGPKPSAMPRPSSQDHARGRDRLVFSRVHDHAGDLTSPTPSALPRPGAVIHPRKKASSATVHRAQHPGITDRLEVAAKNPGPVVSTRPDLALAEIAAGAAIFTMLSSINRRQRQLRIAWPEQMPFGAFDEIFERIAVLFLAHSSPSRGRSITDWRQNREAGPVAQTGEWSPLGPFHAPIASLHMG